MEELLCVHCFGLPALQKKRHIDGGGRGSLESDSITVAERRDNWDQD